MASTVPRQPPTWCDVCIKIPWFELQPEDVRGTPHHKTHRALEESAKTCVLCNMVLRAAISNYRDSSGTRHGRGYWRQTNIVNFSGVGKVTYTKNYGSCLPASGSEYSNGSRGLITASGRYDTDYSHLKNDHEPPDLDLLELGSSTDEMPVWLYGNWWADSKPPEDKTDHSHLRLMGIGARFARSPSPFDVVNLRPGNVKLCGSSISVCATDKSATIFSYIPGRVPEINSGSDTAYRRLKAWLKKCRTNHRYCRDSPGNPELPTRVIDVLSYDRVVTLFESKGQKERYTALSHCWGTLPRLMATEESLEDLSKGVAISFLPKTFQDAINITKCLGIKYLWIDCLCIIQDDASDWEREASKMSQVYSNAYLTISASGSTDSYSGCFPKRAEQSYVSVPTRSLGYDTPRDLSGPHSFTMEYERETRPGQPGRLHLFEEWLPGSSSWAPQRTNIGSFGKHFDPIANEPLSARGWTLQERLLSPRVVHYATDQMYFECETHLVSEDGFEIPNEFFSMKNLLSSHRIAFKEHGLPKSAAISYDIGQTASGSLKSRRGKGGWLSIVENYSRRRLTVSQDKLPAVAGVARAVAESTGDTYLAGLWGRHLLEDLYWRVYAYEELFEKNKEGLGMVAVKGKAVGTAVRPAEYRAPSWSWASIDAPIKYVPLAFSKIVAHVQGCKILPASIDVYGRVVEGRLDIMGPIWEVKLHQPKKPWRKHGTPVKIEFSDERGLCEGVVHLDMPDEPLPSPCCALFLDPAHAIIVKAGEPRTAAREELKDTRRDEISEGILTAEDIKQDVAQVLGLRDALSGAINVTRIGVGEFIKNTGKWRGMEADRGLPPPDVLDSKVDDKPREALHIMADESWGPVREDDPKVWVTML